MIDNTIKSNYTNFISPYSTRNRIKRMMWTICWTIFARPFPKSLANGWKCFLLRLFGAKIAKTAYVYSSAKNFHAMEFRNESSCLHSIGSRLL